MAIVDVERSDWSVTPGRSATLTVGPVSLYVNTADGGRAGFEIALGEFRFDWGIERERIRRCRACGCTDARACVGGCWWVAPGLCSRCERREG